MIPQQLLMAGATGGSGITFIALQVVENGATPSVGIYAGLLSLALSAIVYVDRRERRSIEERNKERRAADEKKDAEIQAMRSELRAKNDQIIQMLRDRES